MLLGKTKITKTGCSVIRNVFCVHISSCVIFQFSPKHCVYYQLHFKVKEKNSEGLNGLFKVLTFIIESSFDSKLPDSNTHLASAYFRTTYYARLFFYT